MTSTLTDVYPKVEDNTLAGQERVRKRELSLGQDDSFVMGDLVLKKTFARNKGRGARWNMIYCVHTPLSTLTKKVLTFKQKEKYLRRLTWIIKKIS